MSTAETLWSRHHIEEIDLSIEIYQPWLLDSWTQAGSTSVYQRIADTGGLVFVRYGETGSVDSFIQTLGDLVTTVSVVSDENIIYCGYSARRMTILLHRKSMGIHRTAPDKSLVHEMSPEEHTVVSIISFSHRDVPILVGYRLPQEYLDVYQPILERIVNSVLLL